MRSLLSLFLLFIIHSALYSQVTGEKFYRVDFTDKGNTRSLLETPEKFLTEQALERRSRHQIPVELSDLPVNEQYVDQVKASGAKIITRSRWFNWIVVSTDKPERLHTLSFVREVKELATPVNPDYEPSLKPFFVNETVEPLTHKITRAATANYYDYGAAYNQISMLKGELLHNKGFRGEGMTIAVLDAGFNSVDIMNVFDSLRLDNRLMGVHNFVDPAGNVYDPSISSHGTMVLSTMAANLPGNMIGTAPQANYWLLRSEDATAEYIMEEYYWVSAAEFADSVGADVINSSLGYTTFDDPASSHSYADMDGNTTVITRGADMAASKGILVVNSAGNSGGGSWQYIGAPADGDSVFSIGAVDPSGYYAYFSSTGPTYDGRIKPTVAGQGLNAAVFTPWGLNYGSGTSFSSPIIAGMSTCLWQAAPQLNNMQLQEIIKASASKAGDPDTLIGWGIPDYSIAMDSLGITGIRITEKTNLTVIPNPFINSFSIRFDRPITTDITVELYSVQGALVMSRKFHQLSDGNIYIDRLDNLRSGIYFLRITRSGQEISSMIEKI